MTLTTINLAALGDTINLTTEVTGTLPIANGGTNSTATTFVNAATNVTGTLPVTKGGTGLASGTTDQFLKFTGSTTLASGAAGGGKVLQVINKTDATYQATSASSFVDTSLSQAITPSSTSSKILIICEQKAVKASGNTGVKMRLNKGANAAVVLNAFQSIGGETETSTRNDFGSTCYFHLDSPNTTSATTYVTSFANYVSGTGAARINNSGSDRSSMVLMEIAG